MLVFIWLGLITVVILGLILWSKHEKKEYKKDHRHEYRPYYTLSDRIYYKKHRKQAYEGFKDRDGERESERPNSYTVDIVNSTKVSQPPFPPCIGYVDEVVYAPSDVNANIGQIKADLANLQMNIPNYVTNGINQQTGPLVKGILRQQGFPLTDDQYGLNCN